MIFNIIDAILNLLNVLSNENKNDSPRKKETNKSVTFTFFFLIISLIILISNKEIYKSEELTLILITCIPIGVFFAAILLIFSIRFSIIKTLEVQNFALILISLSALITSVLILLNHNLKIIF